jgi:hypothetical protein
VPGTVRRRGEVAAVPGQGAPHHDHGGGVQGVAEAVRHQPRRPDQLAGAPGGHPPARRVVPQREGVVRRPARRQGPQRVRGRVGDGEPHRVRREGAGLRHIRCVSTNK